MEFIFHKYNISKMFSIHLESNIRILQNSLCNESSLQRKFHEAQNASSRMLETTTSLITQGTCESFMLFFS